MADQDSGALFGLDGSNPGVAPTPLDNNDGLPLKREASASNTPNDDIYFYSNWNFQDTPPYESYDSNNIAGTSASITAPLFQTASWDQLSPTQHQQHQQPPLQHHNHHHHHQPPPPPPQQQPLPASDNTVGQPNIPHAGFYPPHMASNPPGNPGIGQIQRTGGPTNNLNVLTPAQQEQLRSIAMPVHLQYHSPTSQPSPGSATSDAQKAMGLASPDGPDVSSTSNSRKRKCSADVDEDEEEDDENQPVKKTAHNMIEKRYRTNLNDKIAALRDSVPSLRIMSKSAKGEDTTEDREELHGLTPAHKLNKATVLSKATEYIRHLEKRNTRLLDENSAMQARISAFEKLFMAGAMNGAISPLQQQPPTPMQYPQDVQYVGTPISTPGREPVQGMIQVPDDMKRIISAQMAVGQPYPVPQQQYRNTPALIRQQQIQQQQQQQQMQQGRWGHAGPYFGKLMVGSLAGLMIIEAVREKEQSSESTEGRGLFALPVQLLSYIGSSMHMHLGGHYIASAQVISYLKLLLFLGTFLWVFVPSLFVPSEKNPKKNLQVRGSLAAAPSLASPIHVRRQAWLTAIQTVWVPRHNFLLEAAAILLKMAKLSLRNLIGVHGYQMLTGLTEEQEAARVKAWTIALDAQLAGGDDEINMSRLTLTLLASGTLPDTPLRLMLKALHIRVVLWDLGRSGLHNAIAARLARSRWNEARQLNQTLRQRKGDAADDDDLPDHLAALLDQDCDVVLNDSVIQRAYNLAWNLPTTDHVTEQIDGMDSVVDDAAVRSPMDAVAAWWSSQTVHRALAASLAIAEDDSEADNEIPTQLSHAIKTAPIGSGAQARALVARAVLVDEKRGASIATAIHTLQPLGSPMKAESVALPIIDSSSSALTIPDVQMSLRCAMAIAHLQRTETAAPSRDALRLIESIALPDPTADMSLLGCTALWKVMEQVHSNGTVAETCSTSLERLAGSLRMWIGSSLGDKCGLEQGLRHELVSRCLSITKSVVGMDNDTGYGSMSECEDEDEC